MGLDNYITDPKNHKNAHVVSVNNGDISDTINKNALVVAAHPLQQFENAPKFFTSPDFGIDMNIGISIENTEDVNNGTDTVLWTASEITGDWDIDSDDQNHTPLGSKSIKSENEPINSTLQILNTSDFDLTNFNFLIVWIYVDKDWKANDNIEIYGWDSGTGATVGDSVALEDYFSWNVFDVWQKISIPLEDMVLTGKTIDALRVKIVDKEGKSPKFYMDDIAFEGLSSTAGSGEFLVEPDIGTWLYVYTVKFFIADDYDSTLEDASVPNFAYDKILGISALSNGLLFRRFKDGKVNFAGTMKQLSDLLQFPGSEIDGYGGNTTSSWISVKFSITEPFILKSENQDHLSMVISDDLSELSMLRVSVGCKVEQRQ
jgi:hypothetical protein